MDNGADSYRRFLEGDDAGFRELMRMSRILCISATSDCITTEHSR